MNKKTLSESDICDKFIRLQLERADFPPAFNCAPLLAAQFSVSSTGDALCTDLRQGTLFRQTEAVVEIAAA